MNAMADPVTADMYREEARDIPIAYRADVIVAVDSSAGPTARRAIPEPWEGLFATTSDGLPFIGPHSRYPRQLFALGYGGNGMTLGYFAAQALVRMVQGRARKDDALFGFDR